MVDKIVWPPNSDVPINRIRTNDLQEINLCSQHGVIEAKLELIKEKVCRMDVRLWSIFTLLIVNLCGIIGILLSKLI